MDIMIPKITAYLIDKAIMLSPREIVKAFDEQPDFAEGRPLKNFSPLNTKQLKQICELFWIDPDTHDILKGGFSGTGVQLIDDEKYQYRILLYGNAKACKILDGNINYIKQLCNEFDIKTFKIEKVSFAQSGGLPIKSPCNKCIGTFGGWFKRILDPPNEKRKFVGITNNHVASVFNKYGPGSPVKDKNNVPIGEIEKSVDLLPFNSSAKYLNKADLTFIRPTKSFGGNVSIACISDCIRDKSDAEELYKKSQNDILLCNNSNGQPGKITAILPTFYMTANNEQYGFQDVVQIDTGYYGDSGSLLLDAKERVCGLFFATAVSNHGTIGFANKWQYVEQLANFNFDYT